MTKFTYQSQRKKRRRFRRHRILPLYDAFPALHLSQERNRLGVGVEMEIPLENEPFSYAAVFTESAAIC